MVIIYEVNIKEKHPLGIKKNMSDVAKIVIPGVVITGVHCIYNIYIFIYEQDADYKTIKKYNLCYK